MDRKDVQYILDLIKGVKGDSTFYDIHTHPFEVMDEAVRYTKSSKLNGLYSSVATEYIAPVITDLDLRKPSRLDTGCANKKLLDKMLQLKRRGIYAHIGPKIFADQMRLACVDKIVFLPVMSKYDSGDQQLQLMAEIYAERESFIRGYCVSTDVSIDEIIAKVKWAVSAYGINVLKIHPSLQGIDPSTPEGKDRIERVLVASKEANLKVVVHGGLSPACKTSAAVTFGTLDKLQLIDWSITPEPVVIAHAGAYGHSSAEIDNEVLPAVRRLLSRYSNLFVDTSALEVDALSLVFRSIDMDRICFGSDTLYFDQWAAMVKTWHAIQQTVPKPEESFVAIVSENPDKIFSEINSNILENND